VTDLPPNLPERLWAALWPEYPLLRGDGCYATVHDNGLLIAENIGTLAQMISELESPLPAQHQAVTMGLLQSAPLSRCRAASVDNLAASPMLSTGRLTARSEHPAHRNLAV
jgi:hypothetical protein